MRRLLAPVLCLALTLPAAFAASARDVDQLLLAALGNPPAGFLGDYASATGDPARYETFAETARRILTDTSTTKQPADVTALHLDRLAAALLVSSSLEDRLAAHRARFHARRFIAAVRYHLFKRSLRLAELVGATYAERDAVAAWRELVTLAETHRHPSAPALRADLKKYEASLKDLEEQCCPPDEAVLKEKIWQPARSL